MKIEERNEKVQAILQKHGITITDSLVVDFLVLLENEYDEGCGNVGKQQLTDKELLFVAYLLEQGAYAIAERGRVDLDMDIHTLFSPEEKQRLMTQFRKYNNDWENAEDYISAGYIRIPSYAMAQFMVSKIVKNLAESLSKNISICADLPCQLHSYFYSQESIAQIEEYEAQQEASRKDRDRAHKLKLFQELKEELEIK